MFLGFGFLLCTQCSTKHCMIYQRLETACRLLQVSTEASNLHKSIWQLLANAGWHSLCLHEWDHIHKQGSCGEVTSGCLEETLASHAAPWIPFPGSFSRPVAFMSLSFPLTLPHTYFVLALFWFIAPMTMDVHRWSNAGLRSWMFEQKFHTLFQSCEKPIQNGRLTEHFHNVSGSFQSFPSGNNEKERKNTLKTSRTSEKSQQSGI